MRRTGPVRRAVTASVEKVAKAPVEHWQFWWESSAAPMAIADAAQLDARLADAIANGSPSRAIAELTSPDGARMTVGLAERESVATFSESDEPPYYVSRGTRRGGGDVVVFFFEGHWTEFGAEAVIEPSEAFDALREFFATGARPTRLAWTEV